MIKLIKRVWKYITYNKKDVRIAKLENAVIRLRENSHIWEGLYHKEYKQAQIWKERVDELRLEVYNLKNKT